MSFSNCLQRDENFTSVHSMKTFEKAIRNEIKSWFQKIMAKYRFIWIVQFYFSSSHRKRNENSQRQKAQKVTEIHTERETEKFVYNSISEKFLLTVINVAQFIGLFHVHAYSPGIHQYNKNRYILKNCWQREKKRNNSRRLLKQMNSNENMIFVIFKRKTKMLIKKTLLKKPLIKKS